MAGAFLSAAVSSQILDRVKADRIRNADQRAEWSAFEKMTGGKGMRRDKMSTWSDRVGNLARDIRDTKPRDHQMKIQPGPRIGALENIGRQRIDYGSGAESMVSGNMFKGAAMRNEVMDHALLGRRLHSGDLNLINRRRRVQPRDLEGGERLSFRNTQPNQGTFGIGQGINR